MNLKGQPGVGAGSCADIIGECYITRSEASRMYIAPIQRRSRASLVPHRANVHTYVFAGIGSKGKGRRGVFSLSPNLFQTWAGWASTVVAFFSTTSLVWVTAPSPLRAMRLRSDVLWLLWQIPYFAGSTSEKPGRLRSATRRSGQSAEAPIPQCALLGCHPFCPSMGGSPLCRCLETGSGNGTCFRDAQRGTKAAFDLL